MPAGVEAAGGDIAAPVDYAGIWTVAAWALIALVVLWYAVVLWWGRPLRVRATPARSEPDLATVRAEHLARLEAVAAAAHDGSLDLRAAFRGLSEVARSFVEQTSRVPATTLTLADLRALDLPVVVAALEVIYPPEFAPDDPAAAAAAFDEALALAREVVSASWT
ncbi:hypothetical protein [Nocardioides ferulae]|uniref:hypothetical protein n=1 Tax=Nocardioides ferulae TaxID=2340821 RepID=UPI000EB231AE|nr:hypothetical protein [Nocardioides ferulae]